MHRQLQHNEAEMKASGESPVKLDEHGGPIFFTAQFELLGDNRPSFHGHSEELAVDTKTETISNFALLDDILTSARIGCHLCTLIHHAATTSEWPRKRYYPLGYLELNVKHGGFFDDCGTGQIQTAGHLYCDVHPNGLTSLTISEPGRDFSPSLDDPMYLSHDSQLSSSTASNLHLNLANIWLQKCVKGDPSVKLFFHDRCEGQPTGAECLPARLIDLSTLSSDGKIRLCRTEDMQVRPQYVTLSHCWGAVKPLTLTQATENMLFRGIQGSELPATFKDAVSITHALDFRFLWIDSLCIMQDSEQDWQHESSIMGEIYLGCTLNISALWAKNCNDGCFAARNPLIHRPCCVTEDRQSGLFVSAVDSRLQLENDGGLLSSRGWVVQERMLAPRSLYFGAQAMSWECRTCDANERWPDGLSQSHYDYTRLKRDFASLKDSSHTEWGFDEGPVFNRDMSTSLHVHKKWVKIVEYYTACSLTRSDDIVVAVYGIIRTISEATGLRNVAGLWTDCIVLELMWIPTPCLDDAHFSKLNKRAGPEAYRAPSWSWASVGRKVEFALFDEKSQSQTGALEWFRDLQVDLELDLKDANVKAKPNGQLMHADITVDGQVRRVGWREVDNANHFAGNRSQSHLYEVPYPAPPPPNRWFGDYDPCRSGDLWVLLLARCKGVVHHWKSATRKDDCMSDIGLILEPVDDEGHSLTFRRVGFFEQFYVSGDSYQLFAQHKQVRAETVRLI